MPAAAHASRLLVGLVSDGHVGGGTCGRQGHSFHEAGHARGALMGAGVRGRTELADRNGLEVSSVPTWAVSAPSAALRGESVLLVGWCAGVDPRTHDCAQAANPEGHREVKRFARRFSLGIVCSSFALSSARRTSTRHGSACWGRSEAARLRSSLDSQG